MRENEMPQIERLRRSPSVVSQMELLSPGAYQRALTWIRQHFRFAYGQQIDWSHDPFVVRRTIPLRSV